MLTTLENLHCDLLDQMAVMRGLIALDDLPHGLVTQTRLKLGQTSAARTRFLTDTVYPALSTSTQGAVAGRVRRLASDAAADRMRSSAHVGKWTSAAISADWPGFRRASAGILVMMNSRIEQECGILYPLLCR